MNKFKLSLVAVLVCVLCACQVDIKDNAEFSKEDSGFTLEPVYSKTFDEPLRIVDISGDGNQFLAGSLYEILLLSVNDLNSPIEVGIESDPIALRFVGDNHQIFFANGMGVTRLYDSGLKSILSEYLFHHQGSRYASISDDGILIAYGENIFLPQQNKVLPRAIGYGHAEQTSLQISKQNYVLTSGYFDSSVVVRDAGGNIMAEWRLDDSVQSAAISPNGDLVIASTENSDCYLLQVHDGKQFHRFDCSEKHLFENSNPAWRIHIDSAGKEFVLVTSHSISAYQIEPLKKIFSKKVNGQIFASVLAQNNWLAIGLDNGHVQLWDILHGKLLSQIQENKGVITSIDFNPSVNLLLTGSYDGYLALYRIQSGHEAQSVEKVP